MRYTAIVGIVFKKKAIGREWIEMTISTFAGLDQAELFQLGMNAIDKGETGAALSYLKEAVARPDATALSHFVLAAEYAQIAMYDRAVVEMEAALALDPGLAIARFQLGQLWLTIGDYDRADLAWAPLAELPATDFLNRFGAGLRHLVRREFDDSRRCLLEGIALNDANVPLNEDMQRLLDHAEGLAPAGESAAAAQTPAAVHAAPLSEPASEHAANHLLISAYTGNS